MAARVTSRSPSAARKSAATGPARINPPRAGNGQGAGDPSIPDILRFDTTASAGEADVRIPLFSIDGKVYTIPSRPNLTVGLEATHLSADATVEPGYAATRAVDYVLTEMLGDDGYAALRRIPNITSEQFNKVVAICMELSMGALEGPKDGSGDG
jgi:hypothetical protein